MTSDDRKQFTKQVEHIARIVVPRRKRTSQKLERLKKLLDSGISLQAASDQVCADMIPGYSGFPPNQKASERGKLLANLRAHRSYHRRKDNKQAENYTANS